MTPAQIEDALTSPSLATLDADGWETPVLLGTADIPIPPDNDWSRSDWNVWKPTGIETGPGWVYVRVQGGVDYTWNPECANVPADLGQCGGTPGEEGTSGPWGALGRVSVGFANVGSTTINREPAGAAFAPHGDSTVYGLLVWSPRARTIHLERQMQLGGGSSSSGSIGVPQFFLSGEQTVTVEQVPEPMRIVAPAVARRGGTVVASIETHPPFRVRMPLGFGHHAVSWGYTTVDAAGRPGFRYTLWGCAGSETCSFLPPADGFFNVSTYIETGKIQANGKIVRRVDPALEVTCSAPANTVVARYGAAGQEVRLIRGEDLDCTAGAYPTGTEMLVTGWSFVGSDGFSRSPEELGDGWAGPMAMSGRIFVTAEVEGFEQQVGVDVSVLPRDWSDRRVNVVARQVAGGYDRAFPVRPRGDFQLSNTIFRSRAPRAITIIEDGPNRGLGFLSAITLEVEALVLVNEAALSEGTEFYDLQEPDRPGSTIAWAQCGKSTVPILPSQLLAHEGVTANPTASHIGAYQRELDAQLGGAVPLIEAAVSGDLAELEARYGDILAGVHHAASDAAAELDDTGAGRFIPVGPDGSTCALRYHFTYD